VLPLPLWRVSVCVSSATCLSSTSSLLLLLRAHASPMRSSAPPFPSPPFPSPPFPSPSPTHFTISQHSLAAQLHPLRRLTPPVACHISPRSSTLHEPRHFPPRPCPPPPTTTTRRHLPSPTPPQRDADAVHRGTFSFTNRAYHRGDATRAWRTCRECSEHVPHQVALFAHLVEIVHSGEHVDKSTSIRARR